MQGGDFDPIFDQALHHQVDFVVGQDEVPHDDHVVAHALEGKPGAECEGGLQFDAVENDFQVGAGQPDTIDPARHLASRLAQTCRNLLLPFFCGPSRRSQRGEPKDSDGCAM